MDNEGYPEQEELDLIENWDYKDFLGLLDYLEERWAYADFGFKRYWSTDDIQNMPIIKLELHTAGWSGNESLIEALLSNKMFKMLWYTQWRRGGHFYFEINPYACGWQLVSKFCKDKKISRQAVHKSPDKYDWITISAGKNLIKPKIENKD